ncbi:UNKNOWN [Stylonychia lemnae]|uniref:Uncharacterized protein n=1 Tax=Stylonychia lemnae TaxID=5949 RepID=A0A078AG99_STYLE|nr:UNKNOWN [Stylonychia lemnae]|eukprot:CDW80532.1 UNKNOWN [Stylonychia lemnae]
MEETAGKRQRVDSMIQGALNESASYKRLKIGDGTWSKIDKIIAKSSQQLILFEVPKGFNVADLNQLSERFDLKRSLKKSRKEGLVYHKTQVKRSEEDETESVHKNLVIGIDSLKVGSDAASQFSGGAHITQLLTLLPETDTPSEQIGNLKIGKGINGYVKVMSSIIHEGIEKPQTRNIIKAVPVINNLQSNF